MKKWINFFIKHRLNKYQITIIAFLIVTFFVGDNTLLDGIRYSNKIDTLQKEVDAYKNEIAGDQQRLNALQSDKENLEKFVREHYLMTKPNEELFLIVE